MSEDGFCVVHLASEYLKGLSSGNVTSFSFQLPDGPVRGAAEIRWIKPKDNALGLQISKFDDEEGQKNFWRLIHCPLAGAET